MKMPVKHPVLHRFLEVPLETDTEEGTRAAVFYDGEFYDNVFIRIRGGTARSYITKAYKIEFNDAHSFRLREDLPRVDEIKCKYDVHRQVLYPGRVGL